MKLYCGIDIHKDTLAGCILDKNGTVVREHNFPANKDALEHFICGVPNSEMAIAIEACGMWRGTYKNLSEMGYEVKLANPKKTHDIACNKKTDKVDAKTLADLLRTDYLPEIYIPDDDVFALRDLGRHKATLTRLRVKVQTTIKSYLLRDGIKYRKEIWKEEALSKLAKKDNNLRNLINVYWGLKAEEKEALGRIKKISKTRKSTNLLMSMPGIAEYSSLLILGEIGDIKRFKTPKELVSYAGLCPGLYQSAGTERNVRNHAVNNWLKWILYECSGRAAMFDPRFRSYYSKVKGRKGFQTARRAIARKMLTIIWHMLTKEEPYMAS
ncbi:MAG: IS110 family transposase [Candidatus Altiarchaeota archaeon]|nr:IS110 family transposase [Candidatus Altiarchaeota archaeon]